MTTGLGITKQTFILACLVFCMFAGQACAAELSGNNNVGIDVSNDGGAYLISGNTYQLNLETDMADLHITTDPQNSAGEVTKVNSTTGTFYITCTNDSRVFDDTVLMLAVNGTIWDNFSVSITSSGYTWAVPTENSTLPEFGSLTYISSALLETFLKDDLTYGPQIWKPANSVATPIFTGQNMSDSEDTFSLMFIDLNVGVLCNATNLTGDLTDRGAVKIDYTFTGLESFAVFNAYGLTNSTSAEITTTNEVSSGSASLYSVLAESEEETQESVIANITISPTTATLEINGTANFTATAYDTESSVMTGITFNWSVSDEVVGNVTSEGLFTALSAGTVNVTASYENVTGNAVVTISEIVIPTAEPTAAPTQVSESYGGVISGVNGVYLTTVNDEGLRFNDFGNDTFCIDWSSGGGLNALHIATSSSGYGEVTNTDAMTGTFYATETGGKGYHDEVYLCVAVNGTISDDFRIHITSEGPQWTPGSTEEAVYITPAIDEWFNKDDFIYGPQTWKPAAGIQYPIFPGHDVADTSNTFKMMFIDLNVGTLDSQAAKIQYEIENLNSMLAFAVYGYRKADDGYYNLTGFTNRLTDGVDEYSGWYVSGSPLPDAASITITPSDPASVSVNDIPLNGKKQFIATAYDYENNVISGSPITWSIGDAAIGNIDSTGLFTPLNTGSTLITATASGSSVSDSVTVTVTDAVDNVLTEITLDPDSVLMYTDLIGNKTFRAIGYDQFGDEISSVLFTWGSSSPVVGTIDQTGFFTGLSEGTTTITAENSSVSQTADVVIKQHPDWDVTLIGAINRTLNRTDIIGLSSGGLESCTDNKEIFWEGVNLTSVLALFDDHDPSTFNIGLANLDYNITITGKKSGEEQNVIITSLELINTEKTFITAYKIDGYEIPEYAVDGRTYWPLKLTGSAIVNTGRNVEEITNVTIEFPPDVQKINITSDSVITFAGEKTIQFEATAYDSADLELEHIPFTWSVSDGSIGTIDSDGLFTPLKAGTVNVISTYKSVYESVAVTVLDDTGAMTWTVDQSGSGNFTTIQAAIDYAREGDTIVVRDGTYEEEVTIDKGITLTSENGYDSTVIDHSTNEGIVVTSTADNVRISGFNITGHIKGSYTYGGLKITGDNCVVSDNLFPTAKSISICSDNSTIENNYIIGYGYLDITDCNFLTVCNNVFDNCNTDGSTLSGSGSDVVIFNNSFTSSYSYYSGITISGTYENITITDNQITALNSGYGIKSFSSSLKSLKILNNTFQTCYGISLPYSNSDIIHLDGEIAENKICVDSGFAIKLKDPGGEISIHNNELSSSTGSYVLYLRGCGDYINLYRNNITISSSNVKGLLYHSSSITGSNIALSLNSTKQYSYVYNGETYTNFIGNLYRNSDGTLYYTGTDSTGNGFGDDPFTEDGVSDYSPLISPIDDYLILEAASINITSSDSTLKVGESMNFTASVIDQRGIDFPEAAIVFSSSHPAVGTVDSSTGHFEALSPGTVTITASCEDVIASVEITVLKATKKEATTSFEMTNCTINGNGNGAGSVSVNSSSATVQNNSICMQGSGFNLTIQTQTTPVTSGGTIQGTIENIVLETNPITADLQSTGNVSASVSLNLNGLPAGAGISTTISQDIDNSSKSAFQIAASEDGLNLNAVAYTMNIVKTNLNNGNDIKDAKIRMAVSHAWIVAHGGYNSIKIIRFAEDGTKEVLKTVYVGSDGDMDVFEAYSPNGLSIFGLAATSTATSSSTSSGSYTASGGKSSLGTARVDCVSAGETAVFYLDESAVTEVDVKAVTDIPEMMITSEMVSKPSSVSPAPDSVYQYIKVLSYLEPKDSFEMATMKFIVEDEWIDSVKTTPADVRLYRYDEDSEDWILLSTVEDGKEFSSYKFFADTDSLGLFAITAKENTKEAGSAASSGETGSEQTSPISSSGESAESSNPNGGIPVPYIILALGILIGLPAAGYGWLRTRQK